MFFITGNYKNCPEYIINNTIKSCIVIPSLCSILILCLLYKLTNIRLKSHYFSAIILMAFICTFYFMKPQYSLFNFKTTDFYEKNYQHLTDLEIKKPNKRNVILVFLESFEDDFSQYRYNNELFKINDEEAIKFDNFYEGYAQGWTQGALFSAFTGTHIHYLSDYYRYAFYNKIETIKASTIANHVGGKFEYITPNINYLSDITYINDYINLYVQGSAIDFSGTDSLLINHGYLPNNIYSKKSFKNLKQIFNKRHWWGVPDNLVFELFKEKILNLPQNKPFFATLFTLDLHSGNNPFYDDYKKKHVAVIKNINNFISWFKQQDFYPNTTLILLADHRLYKIKGKDSLLYNAFFNLPENLTNNLNKSRTFNQIDIFATILDILGVDLPNGKAGLGTSLFSEEKTLAEKFSYSQQQKIFSKLDSYYQKLWSPKLPNQKIDLIAHGGGIIDNEIYTNSLEALELSEKKGFKYIELDLLKTNDNPPRIIGAHSPYELFNKIGQRYNPEKFNYEYFKNKKLLNKYTFIFDDDILDFFIKHPDMWLITDKIDDFKLLDEKFKPIKDRMIVEVFSENKFNEAKKYNFKHIAFSVNNDYKLDIAKNNRYPMITVPMYFAAQRKKDFSELKQNGTKILLYTAKNSSALSKMKMLEIYDLADMIYFEGKEHLK